MNTNGRKVIQRRKKSEMETKKIDFVSIQFKINPKLLLSVIGIILNHRVLFFFFQVLQCIELVKDYFDLQFVLEIICMAFFKRLKEKRKAKLNAALDFNLFEIINVYTSVGYGIADSVPRKQCF